MTSFEIPFANQREKTLYPEDFRGFGGDIMLAYRAFVMTQDPQSKATD